MEGWRCVKGERGKGGGDGDVLRHGERKMDRGSKLERTGR